MGGRVRIRAFSLAAGVLAAALAPAMAGLRSPAGAANPGAHSAEAGAFTLRSPDIAPGGSIGSIHVYDHSGCSGGNISPAFSWSHPPAGTRSFALLVFDSDVPEGGFWHWVVFDIPATVRSLRADAGNPTRRLLPRQAVQIRNDFGSLGYGGPCPPSGSRHHYHFMLYALSVPKLGLSAAAEPEQVNSRISPVTLGETEIVATFAQ
jgi:Raf kinase inhibitor-like YbhB/YbcL family protein